jgi:hypothetical protein
MLYNPDWKNDTKIDPLSLTALCAWLETKCGSETYDYANSMKCLTGQWARYCDPGVTMGAGDSFSYLIYGKETNLRRFKPIAQNHECNSNERYTFGSALRAARRELANV